MNAPYSHSTRRTFESRICPGVLFDLCSLTWSRRLAVQKVYDQLIERAPAGPKTVYIDDGFIQAMLTTTLVAVRNLEVDGAPMEYEIHGVTAPEVQSLMLDSFLDVAPEALVYEIVAAAIKEFRAVHVSLTANNTAEQTTDDHPRIVVH